MKYSFIWRVVWVFFLVCVVPNARASHQTLVFCSEGNPEFLTSSLNSNATSFDVTEQIFDKLVDFERGGTQVIPALATRWTVSSNGLEYTFHLRRGVKWQANAWFTPRRDFNADDVVFTFERQWKRDHPFYAVTSAKHVYFEDVGMPEVLASLQKLDDYTVKFTLKQPVAPFVANLAMSWAGIESVDYAQAMRKAGTPEKIDQAPLGTGPFQLMSFEKDVALKYQAFAKHWAGRAKVEHLVFDITPDAGQRWAKLQAGTCHVMAYPNPADLPSMRNDTRMEVMNQTGLNVAYVAYNLRKKPFTDVNVRRALNMAINKRRILRVVYKNTAVPAINPIPPMVWSYNRDVDDDVYDPTAAKKLLADAGYSEGFSTTLWAMPVQRSYMPDAMGVAKLIQEDLAEVGVRVNIESPDWVRYVSGMQAGEHEMGILGWTGDNGDPDNFLNTLLGCTSLNGYNVAKFCYPPYDDVVQKAKISSEIEERTRLYQRAQLIFKSQAPWFTLAHTVQFKVLRAEVEGFQLSPLGRHTFNGVSLKP
ncbi:ABC transporter substrate-binding protein [Limnohabitans sp.]|uniref:ABC transporter substrate-binding protein n=1 Tax=Limnohabitans sp. TaxID=1907725 RepID=UPI00286F3EA9|nr:ABC transporter substrate-binding protein [Limnohabitans sp.]